jgi:hypothetical protein
MDEEPIEETENYIRIGKGRNTILVGKHQFMELLNQGKTVHEALLILAERNQVAWVKGGDICQRMMLNQYIYLRGLGVPHEKIIEHFQRDFPTELKCLIGESISDEEVKENIKQLIEKFSSMPKEVDVKESEGGEDEVSIDTVESGDVKKEDETEDKAEDEEDTKLMLGDKEVENEDDFELYITEKEGWCCGVNPKVMSILTAVEMITSKEVADGLMKEYVMNNWSESELFAEACKHCNREELIKNAYESIPYSAVYDAVKLLERKEGLESAMETYGKYLSGEIKSIVYYVDKKYPNELSK